MFSSQSTKKSKRAKRKGNPARAALSDVPPHPARTYVTHSRNLPSIQDHCLVRYIVPSFITSTAASDVAQGINFSISQTYSGLTSVFDKYMIEAIRFTVVPQNNAMGLVAGLTDLYCLIDYDDSNAPASLAAILPNNNLVRLAPGESLERVFAPRIAISAYNGAFSGFAQGAQQVWCDSASTTIQHYGVKLYVPATGVVGQTVFQKWDITAEYFVRFKNPI